MYSGATHLTVREAIQPRALHRIQSSAKLTSGSITTSIYDTRQFKEVFLLTDISLVSGTNTTLNIQLQTSPDYVNWFPITNVTQRTVAGQYYERLSGYVSEYTKFVITTATSGGCWTQIDSNFIR